MAKKDNTHNSFDFSYRADCTTCEKYVGSKRKSKEQADADAKAHKSIFENNEHDVKIEVTQSFYII